MNYGAAIREAFRYLLFNYDNVFAIGQGLWSPWYVGNSMTDLEKEFGKERLLDTPVSEQGCTGVAVGASLCGYRPVMIHPRMDFLILAIDQIVNQAAKWGHMLGGHTYPAVTVRGIINRGGEQGAQHSQALHSWFAHVPGLRVVMPATVSDARDLLIASVLSNDPVVYIDDRWLYGLEEDLPPVKERSLTHERPKALQEGSDLTLVGCGYSTHLCRLAAQTLQEEGVSVEVIDLRVLNPWDPHCVVQSVKKTGKMIAVDGGWSTCGLAGEIIASVAEALPDEKLRLKRITLPAAPAPTSKSLEDVYYPDEGKIRECALALLS